MLLTLPAIDHRISSKEKLLYNIIKTGILLYRTVS